MPNNAESKIMIKVLTEALFCKLSQLQLWTELKFTGIISWTLLGKKQTKTSGFVLFMKSVIKEKMFYLHFKVSLAS